MATKKGGGPGARKPGAQRQARTSGRPAGSGPGPRRPAPGPPVVPASRAAVASAPALVWVAALPKFLLPVLIAILVLVGLGVGGAAGLICLLLVAAVLGWLLAVFWTVTPKPGRVLRVLAIVAVVVVGFAQAF